MGSIPAGCTLQQSPHMQPRFANKLLALYRHWFCRPQLARFHHHLFTLSLRGQGILNSDTAEATGEPWLLHQLSLSPFDCVIDVGANDQAYGQEILQAKVTYAFEPHPASFQRLLQNAATSVHPIQAAVGDHSGTVKFYDFADTAPRKSEQPTSQLATVLPGVIESHYHQPSRVYHVKMVALDDFAKRKRITHIDLLKIDAEGNELAVLQGAVQLLLSKKIDLIQFEFNELHAYAHVHLKDFYDLLPNFSFYRLLPKDLLPLGPYRPLTHEIFGFQNILAVRNESVWSQRLHNLANH